MAITASSGSCWLYVTFRSEDGTWTAPVHMGDVRGDFPAGLACTSPDGKARLFEANGDIYGIDAKMSSLLFGAPLRSDGSTVEAGDGGAPPKKRAAWNSGQGSLSDAINGLFGN